MTIQEARQMLIAAMRRHEVEASRPYPCAEARQTYMHMVEAQERLARIAAGCNTHMTEMEQRYRAMMPSALLAATGEAEK